MKILSFLLFVALSSAAVFGDEVYSKVKELASIDDAAFPSVGVEAPAGAPIQTVAAGQAGVLPEALAARLVERPVVIDVTRQYDLAGEKKTSAFQLLYFGLEAVVAHQGEIKRGDVLGNQGATPLRVVICADTLDPYLVGGGNRLPVKFADRYWFSPSFLFSNGSTAYLTFDTLTDLTKALVHVADEANDEGPGYVFYPSYRVRFVTKLTELPVPLTDEEKANIAGFENNLYGKSGLYKFKNELVAGPYRYLLCWQGGFDKYLKDEYTLNQDLWLFGGIVSYDVWKKVGYVFLRDFSLQSVETIIANRFEMLK